jgi:hypothetical protein
MAKKKAITLTANNLVILVVCVIALFFAGIFIFGRGSSSPPQQYVCSDGSVVSSQSQCPTYAPAPYCGDGTCNNGETCSTCSTDCGQCPALKTIGIGGFDYDKKTQTIKVLIIEDPNFNSGWTLEAKGYDQLGNLIYTKEVATSASGTSDVNFCKNGCSEIGTNEQIPYLDGGRLNVKLTSENAGVQAVGSYPFSDFANDISFTIAYDHYTANSKEVAFKIANTGKRIMHDRYYWFSYSLFFSQCGNTGYPNGDWFQQGGLRLDKTGDGIITPGETELRTIDMAQGAYSGTTYCVHLDIGSPGAIDRTLDIVFTP